MKRYKVYDLYEDRETIGYADTIAEVKKIAAERQCDTDGECYIVYAELNPETNKYKFSSAKEI